MQDGFYTKCRILYCGYCSAVDLYRVKVFAVLGCWAEWFCCSLRSFGTTYWPHSQGSNLSQNVGKQLPTTSVPHPRPQLHYDWSLQPPYAINRTGSLGWCIPTVLHPVVRLRLRDQQEIRHSQQQRLQTRWQSQLLLAVTRGNISKIEYQIRHVCLSVRMELGSHRTGFHEILCVSTFLKFLEKIRDWLKPTRTAGTVHEY
jgi:hypothetical protein